MSELETAKQPEQLKRVVIDPVTRVEGHGKVTLLVDDHNQVQQARLHIVEFRGFEKFIQGRPYWEVPIMVQRLCGICPVSHHLVAGKAVDQLVGVKQLTPAAEKLRRLLHFGQVLQSHSLHFFHLASPDLLFGFDSDVARRNIIGVLDAHSDIGLKGIKLRKFGQEVIRHITGKRVHGTGCVPGGMNKCLEPEQVQALQAGIQDVINWSQQAVALASDLYRQNETFHANFGTTPTRYMGLVTDSGGLELYDGQLRVKDETGKALLDQFDPCQYDQLIHEQVKSWSYLKFPFLKDWGPENGWYRVGPLARVLNCDRIDTPLAEQQRQDFIAHCGGMVHSSLAYHWARMIETLHCAEAIQALLNDPDIQSQDLLVQGEKQHRGVGVIEAPRGTLIHDYEINDNGQISRANLIVSTTHNNEAMNRSIRQVAQQYLNGRELNEGLLNHIEVAIRAFDPCLSCATHAVGKMPLNVELAHVNGDVIDAVYKDGDGQLQRADRGS